MGGKIDRFRSMKGKTQEERMDFYEKALNRVASHSCRDAKLITPPNIISHCVYGEDIVGKIFELFLFEGNLLKLIVDIGFKPKNTTEFFLTLSNKEEKITKILALDKKVCFLNLDLATKDLDNLAVFIKKDEEGVEEEKKDKLKRVSFSILWQGNVRKAIKESFLFEEILKDTNYLLEDPTK